MLKTYAFFLRDKLGHERFEPGLHDADDAAMKHANALLAANPDCEAVRVALGVNTVVVVARPTA